jgi:hypothetical protein
MLSKLRTRPTHSPGFLIFDNTATVVENLYWWTRIMMPFVFDQQFLCDECRASWSSDTGQSKEQAPTEPLLCPLEQPTTWVLYNCKLNFKCLFMSWSSLSKLSNPFQLSKYAFCVKENWVLDLGIAWWHAIQWPTIQKKILCLTFTLPAICWKIIRKDLYMEASVVVTYIGGLFSG